jgi:gamma-glutamylputrescine oxidase
MSFSFWEHHHYNFSNSVIVVGAGIVGLSTAIELKNLDPQQDVIVVDEYFPSHGASTKNAGFACFGSITEILDDIKTMDIAEVVDIVNMRWQGISILKNRLLEKGIGVKFNGGKELFQPTFKVEDLDLRLANEIMLKATSVKDYFKIIENKDFEKLNPKVVSMEAEGELNPMEMLDALKKIADDLNVKFIFGRRILYLDFKKKEIHLETNIQINYYKVVICTNGFTKRILPKIDVFPARNHVMMTNEIENLKFEGVYHYDQGYYYFRRVGKRILLGGARNLDSQNEMIDEFAFNEKIKAELLRFLTQELLPDKEVYPEYWWTGVLGISKTKKPILLEIEKDAYLGVRLGGMGVAIGSYLGKELAKLATAN